MTLTSNRAYIRDTVPGLGEPNDVELLLLTWITQLDACDTAASNRLVESLYSWINPTDGPVLYGKMLHAVQDACSIVQIALISIAMVIYAQYRLHLASPPNQPVNGSYLADFDAQLRDHYPHSVKKVNEHMLHALIRILCTPTEDFTGLIQLVNATLDRNPPILDPLDSLSDQYWMWRMKGADHAAAFTAVMDEVQQSVITRLEVLVSYADRRKVFVSSPTDSATPTHFLTAVATIPRR